MDNLKNNIKHCIECDVLNLLNRELKNNLTSLRRTEALVTVVKSLVIMFRTLGIPQKWKMKKSLNSNVISKNRKRGLKTEIPKKVKMLVTSILELCYDENSSEYAFRALELLVEINNDLDGNLVRYLNDMEDQSLVKKAILKSLIYFEDALVASEINVLQSVIRFANNFSGCQRLVEDEIQKLRKTSITRFPEISRGFLNSKDEAIHTPLINLSDPSESVEVRQYAYLLQAIWIRHQENILDSETFDSIRAFGKGFKNLEFVGSFGDETKFSNEYFEGESYRIGEVVTVYVPPVIWRLGDKLKVIVKGKLKLKS